MVCRDVPDHIRSDNGTLRDGRCSLLIQFEKPRTAKPADPRDRTVAGAVHNGIGVRARGARAANLGNTVAVWVCAHVGVVESVGVGRAYAGVTGAEFADGRLMPTEFRAITLITYAVPLVKPVTVHEVAVIGEPGLYRVHDPAAPLLLEYFTIYSMIFEPPLLAGATHVTARLALPLVATTDVGLLGTVAGVAGAEIADGRLVPTEFRAFTMITYALPLVRPVTVHEVAVIGEAGLYRVHDPAAPLLLEYFTIYSMIFEPPSLAGATHVTARLALPRVATTDVGLPGRVAAAGADVSVTVAEPLAYPVCVVVIVAVQEVFAATPLTVTKPKPSIDTVPFAEAVPP